MGHKLVRQTNGKFAIYSTIVDRIILYDATEEELVDYYLERERERLERDIPRWVEGKRPGRGVYSVDEIVEEVRCHHGDAEAAEDRAFLEGAVEDGR